MSAVHKRPDYLFELQLVLSEGVARIRGFDREEQDPNTGHRYLRVTLDWHPLGSTWEVVFDDGRVGVNRWTSVDGKEAKELAVSLFCMKPGDTDAEFFSDYTREQMAWVEAHAEELYAAKCNRFGWEA